MSKVAALTGPDPRGTVKSKRPGAREFEKLARTDCIRQSAIILNEADVADVMRHVLGGNPREGQSPIALRLGAAFERRLLDDGAGLLLSAYREQNRLTRNDIGVINTADIVPANEPMRSAKRGALTRRVLRAKLRGDHRYALVLKPILPIAISGREYIIEPDYLVASARDHMFRVGEIKSYYDLDGLTDQEDLRNALRQAAVGYLALRETLMGLGVDRSRTNDLVPPQVDLVLRRVGTSLPSLRAMGVRGESNSILRAFGSFPDRLANADAALAASGLAFNLTDPNVIAAIPNSFRPDCRNFCPLYSACRDEAVARSDLATLGPTSAAHLTAAGSVSRAVELLRGAHPRSPEEAALQAALRITNTELRRSLSA